MLKLSDQEVIVKIKNGEIDNFIYLVKKYDKQIYNFIFKKIKNRDDIEDLVQISFIRFYKAIDRFNAEKPVLPYLFEIVRNEMKMFWRSRKKTVPLDEKITAEVKDVYIEKDIINKKLESLPKEQKKAIELVGEGYSYREIAKVLNRPINTIRTIIRRTRLKLRGSK